jgi:micrococcal nuclease
MDGLACVGRVLGSVPGRAQRHIDPHNDAVSDARSRGSRLSRLGRLAAIAVTGAGLVLSLVVPPASAGEWDAVQSWETARITRIVDGDTLIVRDEVTRQLSRIRFLGINAPEKPTPAHPGQCGWWQASDALAEIAPVGTRVRLASLDRSSKGRMKRPQRTVLAWNPATQDFDLDLAWAMAERGWAIWFTVAREAAMSAKYRAVIEGARDRRVGLWNPTTCGSLEQPEARLDLRISRAPGSLVPADEWVTVRNTGDTAVDLSGWVLRDSGNQGWFTFPGGSVLAPGDFRTVSSGTGVAGSRTGRDLYVGAKEPLYQDPGTGPYLVGDGAYLLDRAGAYRFWREYPCVGRCATDPLADVTIDSYSLGKKKGVNRAQTQYVRLANWGNQTRCLDGARIETGTSVYRFASGVCLPPGGTWTLLGGPGVDTPTTAYWNRTVPALWASGTLALIDDLGRTAATRTW